MKIVIVGIGVIGASFAMALKNAGYTDVYGIDTCKETIQKAKEKKLIKEGSTEGKEILKNADLTIICIYPDHVKNFVQQNINNFKENSIITDTTGIKEHIIAEIEVLIPNNIDFIFGHPMAGREKKGIEYGDANVFKGANYILTPTVKNKPENLDLIESLVINLGFKRVRRISPKTHDEIIAFTSQLPHAMAVALINSDKEDRDTGSYIGDSYRDLTRIANINDELWSELFLRNKNNLLKAINDFEFEIDLIKKAIGENDKETLRKIFQKSSKRREKL